MEYMVIKTIGVLLLVLSGLTIAAQPSPTPGKEQITIDLPETSPWKGKKIPKDTKAIRGKLYTVRGRRSEAIVDSVVVTTIDKRYFPMKAEGAPEEKWAYIKTSCPAAELTIVNQKVASGRTAILYTVQSAGDNNDCGTAVLLAYIAEGPTALHTIEVYIPKGQFNDRTFGMWCDILLAAEIS